MTLLRAHLKICHFSKHSAPYLFDNGAVLVRDTVFVKEQGVPKEAELDKIDDTAYHVVIFIDTADLQEMIASQSFRVGKVVEEVSAESAETMLRDGLIVPVATARTFPAPLTVAEAVQVKNTGKITMKIGRVAVIRELRSCGLGSVLMQAIEKCAVHSTTATDTGKSVSTNSAVVGMFKLHSQSDKRVFYEKQGYETVRNKSTGLIDEFVEDGIMHVAMIKSVDSENDGLNKNHCSAAGKSHL